MPQITEATYYRRRNQFGGWKADCVIGCQPGREAMRDRGFAAYHNARDDGRPVEIVSIVDEHTRECLGGLVERSISLIGSSMNPAGARSTAASRRRLIVCHRPRDSYT